MRRERSFETDQVVYEVRQGCAQCRWCKEFFDGLVVVRKKGVNGLDDKVWCKDPFLNEGTRLGWSEYMRKSRQALPLAPWRMPRRNTFLPISLPLPRTCTSYQVLSLSIPSLPNIVLLRKGAPFVSVVESRINFFRHPFRNVAYVLRYSSLLREILASFTPILVLVCQELTVA